MRPQRVLKRARKSPALTCAALALVLIFSLATHARKRVVFEITPVSFSECAGPNIVARVAWDASRVTDQEVRIFIYKMGNRPTLWNAAPVKGEADTGKWVADGSTLELVDHRNKVLAKRTMQSTPCKQGNTAD